MTEFAIGGNGEVFRVGDEVVWRAGVYRVDEIDRIGESDPFVTISRPLVDSDQVGLEGPCGRVTEFASAYHLRRAGTPVVHI